VTAPDDAAAFETLTRRISREVGLDLDAYKDKCMRRRIAVRMRACGVHTFGEYQLLLDRTPAEYERLRDALTINVTRFYRNRETWDALRAAVLPDLWTARQGRLSVWSAGCSSGEEPYTIAMIVADIAERAGHPAWLDRLTVDATDIDRASLERAAAARYRQEAFVETPAELVARYTEPAGPGERVVTDRVRARVGVRTFDLSADRPPRLYDLIVCRNVVIYFDRAMQERLFLTFAEWLAPGGVLVLGKVETLLGPARDRLTLLEPRERIYRRAS
jgi:chemotaxis methyl-accepting protein methylase